MPLAFPFEISNRRGVRKYTLRIKVCQCYQLHFSTRLCVKQTFRESAFGENIVVEIAARSEHRGVVPYQIEFLHADFLILIVTRTNEIVPASDRRCVFFRRCDCGDASGDSCCGGRPWVSDPSAETAGHRHCQVGRV